MAEATKKKSKIPRYVKTNVPIISKDYKAVLKKVKMNKLCIEEKEAELLVLVKKKDELCQGMDSMNINLKTKRLEESVENEFVETSTPVYNTSNIRNIIQTPGGTKRKVRTSHVQFKSILTSFLRENVRINSQGELQANDLLERLKCCRATNSMSRTMLLKEVSSILDKQLSYRGKKKVAFYSGFELIPNTSVASTSKASVQQQQSSIDRKSGSPASKIPRDSVQQQQSSVDRKSGSPASKIPRDSVQQQQSSIDRKSGSPASKIPRASVQQQQSSIDRKSGSPASKIPRDTTLTKTKMPDCKTKLSFEGSVGNFQSVNLDSNLCGFGSPFSGGFSKPLPAMPMMMDDDAAKEKFQAFYHSLCSSYAMAVSSFNESVEEFDSEHKELTSVVESMEDHFVSYLDITSKIIVNQQDTIKLYKEIVDSGQMLGGLLSISERNQIKEEVEKTKKIFNLGIRESGKIVDMLEILDPGIFQELLYKLKADCPTIMNILEQLVLSPNVSRNVKKNESTKLKASVHLLASLMDVRDQNAKNDLPLLFGLLCLCYGAGPPMIELMQHLGLSESHRVLCNVLQNQLVNYRELIKKRLGNDVPVITYQDNMQLMRTSMRHLRLSKLQKDKLKQGKMWDFTVRGWRKADIEGIEESFKEAATATVPQVEDLTTLQYADTKIENNPVHLEKWEDFKNRNILRKLDKSLNQVPLSADELQNAGIDEMKRIAEQENNKESKSAKYIIKIPDIPIEFPHLYKKQTQVYPLPISHENQCTTLGLGRNLDMFSEEFGFVLKQKQKFLPLKKTGKEFNLELGYTRFAFLKAMERHKEQQKLLETTLRGESVAENDEEGSQLLYVEELGNNSSSDED